MLGVQLSEVTAVPAVLLMYNIKERVLWFFVFFFGSLWRIVAKQLGKQ